MILLDSASTGLNPSKDLLTRTVAANATTELTVLHPLAGEAPPITCTQLSDPAHPSDHTGDPGSSTIAIDGATVTIGPFTAGAGKYRYRLDAGANWMFIELTVTA